MLTLGLKLSLYSTTAVYYFAREYAAANLVPDLVLDFAEDRYYADGEKTFSDVVTHSATTNGTMVDSDGKLKWRPHNLLARSTLSGATVGVVGSGGSLPTGWEISSSVDQIEVLEVSTYNGDPAIRVRLDFDNTSGGTTSRAFRRTFSDFISVVDGVQYTTEVNVNIISHNSTAVTLLHVESNNSGTFVAASVQNITETGWQLVSLVDDVMAATVAQLRPYLVSFNIPAGLVFSADFWISAPRTYRSDLGGMVNNPDRGDSYVPTTTSARYLPRRGHHIWNGSAWVNEGLLHESEVRTNLIPKSEASVANWTQNSATVTDLNGDYLGSLNGLLVQSVGQSWNRCGPQITFSDTKTYTVQVLYAEPESDSSGKCRINLYGSAGALNVEVNGPVGGLAEASTNGATLNWLTNDVIADNIYVCEFNFTMALGADATSSFGVGPHSSVVGEGVVALTQMVAETTGPIGSYIPTNGAAATRAAETITLPSDVLPLLVPNVIGPELVTNGTFDVDATGWNSSLGAILTVTDGVLRVSEDGADGATARAFQIISTEVGKVYRITVDMLDTNDNFEVYVNNNPNYTGAVIVSNTLTTPQTFEAHFVATSTSTYIILGAGSPVTGRYGEYDNVSVREIDPLSVSFGMSGRVTYADTDKDTEARFYNWSADTNKYILSYLQTNNARTGMIRFAQNDGTNFDSSATGDTYLSPGILVPYRIASRHGSNFVTGAVDGTLLSTDTTPLLLTNLQGRNLLLAQLYLGTIKQFTVWGQDLSTSGIVEASEPSIEPSLFLSFDGSESSFAVLDWSE